jgi:hypothetical protein
MIICINLDYPRVSGKRRIRGYSRRLWGWLAVCILLAGCTAGPPAKVHYTLEQDPGSRPLQRVVLLPVDVDVYEMSAGGVKEEVPEWSRSAEANVRSALLVSREAGGNCCVTEPVDTSALTPQESELLEEHLALFDSVIANAISWESVRKTGSQRFDYTLGEGLAFLKTKYGIDAGLIILGEDVVSTTGRKTTAVVGAMFGVAVPLGHSILMGGLVDFASGDLLWMNYQVAAGGTEDLRDAESCLALAKKLMAGYPGLQTAVGGKPATE